MTCEEVILAYLRHVTMNNPENLIYNHTLTEFLPKFGRDWFGKSYSGGTYERTWRIMNKKEEVFKRNELAVEETENEGKEYKVWLIKRIVRDTAKLHWEAAPTEAGLFL